MLVEGRWLAGDGTILWRLWLLCAPLLFCSIKTITPTTTFSLSLSLSLPLFSLPADNNLDSSARPNMNIEVVTSPIFPGPSTYLTTPSRPPLWNLWWTAKCQWSKYEELESWPITRHHDMRQTIRQTESNSTRKRSIRLLTHHSQANTSCKTKSRKFKIQSYDFNVILA